MQRHFMFNRLDGVVRCCEHHLHRLLLDIIHNVPHFIHLHPTHLEGICALLQVSSLEDILYYIISNFLFIEFVRQTFDDEITL